jgi:site-specific recombinase XerD
VTDPFNGLLASFQLALEAEGKSPKTLDNYSRADVQYAAWLRERGLVDDVTTVTADDVRPWLVSLQGKVAPSTEYRNYSGLRQFFALVRPRGRARHLADGEHQAAEGSRAADRDAHQGADQGAAGVLRRKDLISRRDTAIILLLADTGMRRSELANLTTEDLDLRGRVVAVEGKGDASHR